MWFFVDSFALTGGEIAEIVAQPSSGRPTACRPRRQLEIELEAVLMVYCLKTVSQCHSEEPFDDAQDKLRDEESAFCSRNSQKSRSFTEFILRSCEKISFRHARENGHPVPLSHGNDETKTKSPFWKKGVGWVERSDTHS